MSCFSAKKEKALRLPSACRKRLFDTFDENLRISIEMEKDSGLLKISRFSGRNPDYRYDLSFTYAIEKSNPTHMSPDLIK